MSGGLLSLKWNHHRSTFLHILRDIKEKDQFSDVVLACDGKFYNAHKLVLATCSEYFENMFQQTQCKQPVIVLKDISRIELEALLSYMYDGEVNVLQENLSTLIKAAECLKIKGLAVADEDPAKSELISSKRKQLSNDTSSKDNSYRYSSKDSNSERNSRNKRSHTSSDDNSSKENLSKKRKESSTSDSEDAVNDNNLDGSDINNVTYQNHEENVKQEPVELSDHDEKLVISQSLEALSNSVQNNSDDSEFRSEKTNSLNINDNRSNDSTANEIIEGKYSDRDDGGDTAANEISSLWLNNEIDDSLSQQAGSSRYNDHSHQLHPAGANKSDSESVRKRLEETEEQQGLLMWPECVLQDNPSSTPSNEVRSSEKGSVAMNDLAFNAIAEMAKSCVVDFFSSNFISSNEVSVVADRPLPLETNRQPVDYRRVSARQVDVGSFKPTENNIVFPEPGRRGRRKTGEPPAPPFYDSCPYCGYRTKTKANLVTHIRRHTGEKRYICNHCGKRFVAKSELNMHLKIHTREKMFKCRHCRYMTPQNAKLRLHIEKRHFIALPPVEVEKE